MKLLFLDIDGVLNWGGTDACLGAGHPHNNAGLGYIGLCPERIARLNKIFAAHPDVKVVVSSTWRHSWIYGVYENFDELKELLKKHGITQEIVGRTRSYFSSMPRGGEIREYVENFKRYHPDETLEAFVILDDDASGMQGWRRTPSKWDDPDDESLRGRDLRAYHVRTSYYGEDGYYTGNVGTEGGLQDKHVEDAIKVLAGGRLPVKINRYDEDNDNWVTVEAKDDDEAAAEDSE